MREDQVTQVRGFADQRLRKPDDPMDPSNRRISLIVQYLNKTAAEAPAVPAGEAKTAEGKAPEEPAKPAEKPASKK